MFYLSSKRTGFLTLSHCPKRFCKNKYARARSADPSQFVRWHGSITFSGQPGAPDGVYQCAKHAQRAARM